MGKVSALSALTVLTDDDLLYVIDSPGTTPASKKITFANLVSSVLKDSGNYCVGLGAETLASITSGIETIAIGYQALKDFTSSGASGNIAIGIHALQHVTTGAANIGIGYRALIAAAASDSCIAIGYNAMATIPYATECCLVGYEAGSGIVTTGHYAKGITGLGYEVCGYAKGDYNTGLGHFALRGRHGSDPTEDPLEGTGNIGVGHNAGRIFKGDYNIAIGYEALIETLAGSSNNIGIGAFALSVLTTGSNNLALGLNAGLAATTGSNNLFLGQSAGKYETGSSKLFIDELDRTNEATARTNALLYGIFDSTPANQALTVNGILKSSVGLKSADGSDGISTTITAASLATKTITVKNGLITGFA